MSELQENSGTENTTLSPQENPPRLYSKTIILVFALLFSTIFSAVLLMINLRTLGKRSAAIQVLIFGVLYLIATGVVIQLLSLQPSYTFIANVIGAAILNEYFWNRHIGRDREYIGKSWLKPLSISLLIALSMFLLLLAAV
ncbi:hypothetical protein [Salinimicrobium soli]|uniref:hypothetical protein n=1 Tax=Salinimicrobium soli TaxID=1254399 RepID=UPI003AAC829D